MAGHSQFHNIMYRKGAQDAKRARRFAKISREITVAAKLGGKDPSANPRLRTALTAARENNMPKDNVEKAIAKAANGNDFSNFADVQYEGYGPGGVAIIVEALTDNRNRTASDIRSAFSKFGGNLGETGSVSCIFNRVGCLLYRRAVAGGFDAVYEYAVELGADDVFEGDKNYLEVITSVKRFAMIRDSFTGKFGDPVESGLIWVPTSYIPYNEEISASLEKLLDVIEDNDDAQRVFHNMEQRLAV
ncbi:MAG: YebC/PmpR family DNA-binding transcriptional regulator [Holosporales bacterium]|jgi:YebC/PmpR family DNA-binding regulatory protein|nr:YebC/PmpR family DNA-binding transcriptional regulator [Holosporales bacterium]